MSRSKDFGFPIARSKSAMLAAAFREKHLRNGWCADSTNNQCSWESSDTHRASRQPYSTPECKIMNSDFSWRPRSTRWFSRCVGSALWDTRLRILIPRVRRTVCMSSWEVEDGVWYFGASAWCDPALPRVTRQASFVQAFRWVVVDGHIERPFSWSRGGCLRWEMG